MKKTRTLMLALLLPAFSTTLANAAYDAFYPQADIVVQAGETVSTTGGAYDEILTTPETAAKTDNRTAIIKDGQGTFVIDTAQEMQCPIVVREGTMLISGVTVTDLPPVESCTLSVGGINAVLELDHATFDSHIHSGTGYVQAVNIGGRDGDAKLILKNGSVLSGDHCLFVGYWSEANITGTSLGAHICGSYVDDTKASLYREYSYANGGFANQYEDAITGNYISTADVLVSGGSVINVGTELEVGNGTMTITGVGSVVKTHVRGSVLKSGDYGDVIGWVGTKEARTVFNVLDGGQYLLDPNTGDDHHQDLYISFKQYSSAVINVDGKGSLIDVHGHIYDGYAADTYSEINITNGGALKVGSETATQDSQMRELVMAKGKNSVAVVNVDGEGSTLTTYGNLWVGSGENSKAEINITKGGVVNVGETAIIGCESGVTAIVNVDGESVLNTTYGLCVSQSTGGAYSEINVTGGGKIEAGGAYLAWGAGTSKNSHAVVTLSGAGSELHSRGYMYVGEDAQNTGCTALIAVDNGAKLRVDDNTWLYEGATVEIGAGSTYQFDETHLRGNGAALINRGTLLAHEDSAAEVLLYDGSRLQTGTALISGRETLNADGDLGVDYSLGFDTDKVKVYTECNEGQESNFSVTIGALLEGDGVTQYLKKGDMDTINAAVLKGLDIGQKKMGGVDDYSVTYKYVHEIGKNLAVEYTTDDLNKETGTEKIAVTGGAIVVTEGKQTEEGTKIGTIGSFAAAPTETAAHVAVSETNGGTVVWHGTGMQTVAGETATLAKGASVQIVNGTDVGTLTVVKDSTLNNQTNIKANVYVADGGTLKGSGSFAKTDVYGNLIVGNSPGHQTYSGDLTLNASSNTTFSVAGFETPAAGENVGWGGNGYSQIEMTDGKVAQLLKDMSFTIEFGGDNLYNTVGNNPLQFEITLIKGAVEIDGYENMYANSVFPGAIDVTDYLKLNNNVTTNFIMTEDVAAGMGTAQNMEVNVDNYQYFLTPGPDGGLTLQANVTFVGAAEPVPEPATGTLSLLSLAALAARRRRK